MLRSLKTAATGMDAQTQLLDTISNNIANVNTTGFKRSRAHFNDLLYQNLRAPGMNATSGTILPSSVQVGNGVKLEAIEKVFSQGAVKVTNREFDVMVEGAGFLRVQMPDGSISYTRDGSLMRAADGRLVTRAGLPVVPEIIMPAEMTSLNIGYDGTVTAKIPGEKEPRNLGQITIANFVNNAGLNSIGRNLFQATVASGEAIVGVPGEQGIGQISQGQLEASNVDIIDEMVQMITAQRAYELSSKVIKTGDEMLAATNQMR